MWRMSSLAPRHMGSSQTRCQTGVPCFAKQILNLEGKPLLRFFDVDHFKTLHWVCYNIASALCLGFSGHEACGILALWPGIEPGPSALEGEVLTTGPPGKSLFKCLAKSIHSVCITCPSSLLGSPSTLGTWKGNEMWWKGTRFRVRDSKQRSALNITSTEVSGCGHRHCCSPFSHPQVWGPNLCLTSDTLVLISTLSCWHHHSPADWLFLSTSAFISTLPPVHVTPPAHPRTCHIHESSYCLLAKSCPTLWDPMDCSFPGTFVLDHLPEFTQTQVHWVGDAIQPSHSLSSPSPLALNLSQHQGLFQWVSSSHQVAKVLEFQLQHHSFQCIFRVNFL